MIERETENQINNPEAQAYLAKTVADSAKASGDFDKLSLAGKHYEQAFLLFPKDEKGKRIAAAKSSIACFKHADNLRGVVRVGTDLLNNYASEIPATDRAELSDLVHLTKIRLGQEE